jgi:hypothetical protein
MSSVLGLAACSSGEHNNAYGTAPAAEGSSAQPANPATAPAPNGGTYQQPGGPDRAPTSTPQ